MPDNAEMLILASASPRRRELLTKTRIFRFRFTRRIPEDLYPNEDPIAYVTRLAREKAQAIFDQFSAPEGSQLEIAPLLGGEKLVVLGADTTVTLDNHILGKPEDAADAAHMLRLLSGRTHQRDHRRRRCSPQSQQRWRLKLPAVRFLISEQTRR